MITAASWVVVVCPMAITLIATGTATITEINPMTMSIA
jgi:hypothetical protein